MAHDHVRRTSLTRDSRQTRSRGHSSSFWCDGARFRTQPKSIVPAFSVYHIRLTVAGKSGCRFPHAVKSLFVYRGRCAEFFLAMQNAMGVHPSWAELGYDSLVACREHLERWVRWKLVPKRQKGTGSLDDAHVAGFRNAWRCDSPRTKPEKPRRFRLDVTLRPFRP